jgi:hypothetical protein
MSILSFKYTGAYSTELKPKVCMPVYKPSDKYFCVDITELSPSEQGEIAAEFDALQKKYRADIEELMIKYDIKHAYRYFFESRMTDLVEEEF